MITAEDIAKWMEANDYKFGPDRYSVKDGKISSWPSELLERIPSLEELSSVEAAKMAAPAKPLIVEDATATHADLAEALEANQAATDLDGVKAAVDKMGRTLQAIVAKMAGESGK